jgi:hypothetical protein
MELNQLAIDCGFSGVNQTYSSLLTADEQSVKNFLHQVRLPAIYNSAWHELPDEINKICAILQDIKPREAPIRVLGG